MRRSLGRRHPRASTVPTSRASPGWFSVVNDGGGVGLLGRERERDMFDGVVASVLGGQSRVLVLRGEAGVGKSALLDALATSAPSCRIARAAGVESEMELAFAGLHQLCASMLDHRDRLPGPQRDALATA